MRKIIFLATLALLIASCKTTENIATVDANTIEDKIIETKETVLVDFKDKQWNLVELNGKEITRIENQTTVANVTFATDLKINGSSGCNGFGGTYTLEGAKLTVSPLMGTIMYCEGITYEAEFLKVFSDGVEISATDSTLNLVDSASVVVGKFELDK